VLPLPVGEFFWPSFFLAALLLLLLLLPPSSPLPVLLLPN
jgi:hypothetical protein